MIFLDLLIGFLEVGLFSFGGAYAAIPLIRDVVLAPIGLICLAAVVGLIVYGI